MINCYPDPGSFRDPAGCVVCSQDGIYRTVTPVGMADYRQLVESGLAAELLRDGLLVPFTEAGTDNGVLMLKLEKLPFISYPYEWCFGQLRDAAALTLKITLRALEHGMILKDATAYNVSWRGGCPIFIDHGSFTVYQENSPWTAYRQFCRHFLAPLLLMVKSDIRYAQLLRFDLDGIPLDFASRQLPWTSRFELTPLMHIHLHAKFERRYSDSRAEPPAAKANMPKPRLIAMLTCLLEYIEKLPRPFAVTEWGDYEHDMNYSAAAFAAKKQAVDGFCRAVAPGRVIDFGANTGVFSAIASRHSPVVVAADVDPMAVESAYAAVRGAADAGIYPVLQDLNNPSPGMGIFNEERRPFTERMHADLALGLALIHHLRIGSNWPLRQIVRLFATAAPNAMVEFVPKSDSQVKRLLRSRPDICDDWTLESVAGAFAEGFQDCALVRMPDTDRVLLKLRGANR